MLYGVVVGYFPVIRENAERNLQKAFFQFLSTRRVNLKPRDRYDALNKVRDKMRRLFEEKLTLCAENCSGEDLLDCRSFFTKYKKKLSTRYQKTPVPEEEDMVILVSTSKLSWNRKGILSDDAHFTDYKSRNFW